MTGSKSRKSAFSDIPPAAKDSKTGGISESAFSESSDDFTVGAFSSESIDPISEKEMWGDVLLTLACVYAVSSGQEMPSSSPVSNGGFDMSPLHLSWNQVRNTKRNLKNLILEGLFIQGHLLRFSPFLAGKRNWMCGVLQPSKMRFLRFRLTTKEYSFFKDCVIHPSFHGASLKLASPTYRCTAWSVTTSSSWTT